MIGKKSLLFVFMPHGLKEWTKRADIPLIAPSIKEPKMAWRSRRAFPSVGR
jgi:hypothetical protein